MLNKNKIATVVEKFLGGTDKFLIEVEVSKGNVVDVFVDGDDGITISECVKISRHIESNFDRDLEDYELRVSSPGLSRPLKLRRQYGRYVNRDLKLKMTDDSELQGTLLEYSDDMMTLEVKGKNKKSGTETREIAFDEVREVFPVISFK